MKLLIVEDEELAVKIADFKAKTKLPVDVTIRQTGQSEQEAETQAFLGTALLIALGIIFLILVLQFVGFVAAYRHAGTMSPFAAGSLGALLTIWVTFVPCFFWIFLGAPYIEALRENKALSAALSAITAAVVGVVMNLALWFALHVIFGKVQSIGLGTEVPVLSSIDWRAALLSAAAMIAMLKLKIGMLPTLAGSALAGLVLLAV